MQMKLSNYKVTVTKADKEEVYHYSLPYHMIWKDVKKFYKDGADAVEMEVISQEEFDRLLPKP